MGKKNFNIISSISKIRLKPIVDLRYKKKAGIIIPSIDYKLLQERQLPAYSFEISSHYLDELIIILKSIPNNLTVKNLSYPAPRLLTAWALTTGPAMSESCRIFSSGS